MAGSLNHIVSEDGQFRMDLIENLGDAEEALHECFHIIRVLAEDQYHSRGDVSVINRVCDKLKFPRVKAYMEPDPAVRRTDRQDGGRLTVNDDKQDGGADTPANLVTFVERLDADIVKLTGLVRTLQVLDGQVGTRLYGTTPEKPAVDDSKRGSPSLASISGDLEAQLTDLGDVVESLERHIGLGGKDAFIN